jgi:amino acid adenylation domain-containing protein
MKNGCSASPPISPNSESIMPFKALQQFLAGTVQRCSTQTAVAEPGNGALAYAELQALSLRLRNQLHHLGVRSGDRVGIYTHKSIDAVATIFGILQSGAAYVPVDPNAPASRNAYILQDCSVKVIVIERQFVEKLVAAMEQKPPLLILEGTGGGEGLRKALTNEEAQAPAPAIPTVISAPDDLAYILYTSGSTGKPKGVMLSHRNAVSFVNWCSGVFAPAAGDRFSSHAPFHFDLSIFDLYVSLKHGATLVLIPEEVGKAPKRLAALIAEQKISVWYSAPSILALLAQYGEMDQHDYSNLRHVLFAGEVFPVKHLRALKKLLPQSRYFNLYGPTETNVCTFYEIPALIPEDRQEPFPIGKTCSHLRSRVTDDSGNDVPAGQEGELCIAGAGVMQGYWNLPERTANAFLIDATGERWYKTGDLVIEQADGNYTFIGRKDRMVKKRGYRIELGEIEAALYRHSDIKEAAVIAIADEDNGVRIKTFLSCHSGERLSLIALKGFCAQNLPAYMIPDLFAFHETLPKTSTDKIDYQRLKTMT